MTSKTFFATMLLFFNTAFAINQNLQLQNEEMQKRAAIYLTQKSELAQSALNKRSLWNSCTANSASPDCINFVAGNYPSADEKLAAARSCVGVSSVDCVKFVAGNYPNFDERIQAAKACRNNSSMDCVKFVAGNYPNLDERTRAAQACNNADISCVKAVAPNYPNLDERINAAKACGGN